jgi:ADP-ribose pyrophosphatase YjhB (NUDIX family)
MTTKRKFAHFKRNVAEPRIKEIPNGGFCISTFLIISKRGHPNHVLMGHLNRNAPWDHIGALDLDRVERHSKGWMLPSSGLIFGESPQEAAKRILEEQLGLHDQNLEGPQIYSEIYGDEEHWDLEFLFLGERENAPSHNAWLELKFVDLSKTHQEEIARLHEDVLAHVGKWSDKRR